MIQVDTRYMRRALELAHHGLGGASPNPMVGAVIVGPDGRIIGEGYHRRCGQGHAEVNAVASVREADLPLLHDSTMYVTLEPCSHQGRTPPCARMIIDRGIPRVVVGAGDPFKAVAGRGIAMLRDAGVEVVEHVLEDECRALNARFMTAHEHRRPFVTLKWAQSSDGWLDSSRPHGHAERFSTPLTTTLVHRLRSLHDAIVVGSGTVLADDPRLDCRLWPAGRPPQPVILDRRGRIDVSKLQMPVKPMIISDAQSVKEVLETLYDAGMTSVLVEGGASVLQSFIDAAMWDVARVETAPRHLGDSGRHHAPRLRLNPINSHSVDGNIIDIYSNNSLFSVKNL